MVTGPMPPTLLRCGSQAALEAEHYTNRPAP